MAKAEMIVSVHPCYKLQYIKVGTVE